MSSEWLLMIAFEEIGSPHIGVKFSLKVKT